MSENPGAAASPPGGGGETTQMLGAAGVELDYARAVGMDADTLRVIEALPPTSALLIVEHGPNGGARFLLDRERTSAGRSIDADIFLDDVTVSRKHAEFVRLDDSTFQVRDVGSLNGTYVNRDRIDATTLAPGDEVQIGKFRLTFHPSPRRVQPS